MTLYGKALQKQLPQDVAAGVDSCASVCDFSRASRENRFQTPTGISPLFAVGSIVWVE